MKKILVLNYEFPPLGGGAANATYYLLKEFARDPNLQIDLVTSSVDTFRVEKFSENITIHFLDIKKNGNFHYQSMKDLLRYSFLAYRYCKKLKTQKEFDLIHAFFGIPCGYIAMKLRLPYIVSLRGSDVPFYNKRFQLLDTILFQRLSRKIWKNAKLVIANSDGLKDLAFQTTPTQNIGVIYNGVDTEKFCPIARKEENSVLRLVSTGRLIERKGYQYLLEAMKNISGVELTLVGDGNLRESLEKYALENSLNVKFLGRCEQAKIVEILQNSDVFVLPSQNEGMSNSILEAMACGLPVITTNTGGSSELIQENGFIIEKENVKALEESIQKFIENKNLLTTFGINSRKMAEKMSWKNVAVEYKRIYELA